MTTVLLVDDDEFFRKAVRMILEKSQFQIAEAPNGRVARDILAAGKFDIIISDIQMPFFSGLELLEWTKKFKPTPIILITGFGKLLETQKAIEMGAAGFLTKPFKDTDIIEALNKVINPPKEENNKSSQLNFDDQYCKVSITDFVMGKQIPFAVSIRLSQCKYIKVAHRGENIDVEQIKTYKTKGITHLYVKKEDYAQLVGFNLRLAKALNKINNISPEKKQAFIKYTGEVVLEQAFAVGLDENTFRSAKDYVQTSLSVIAEDEETLSLLMHLNDHSDREYAHALGVSAISVMVAQATGWNSPANVFKVSLSGLFHDIGKKELDKEIIEKPRHLLTTKERSLIETHVVRGKEILQALKSVPEDIIQVAYQHHEDCLAHGYPRRLKKAEIHPFARIIYLADLFCNFTMRGGKSEGMGAKEAIAKIETFHKEEVDDAFFSTLKNCLAGANKTAA